MAGVGTADDVDHIVEADAAVALVGPLEGGLQLRVFVFGQDRPFFVQQLVEICTALSAHRVIFFIF